MFGDYYWRHRIYLGDSKFTPGRKSSPTWDDLGLPEDMNNKSFLDIGASDGLYSFEAERRGADKVLATDIWEDATTGDDWECFMSKETFNYAHDYLDSNVESKYIDIMNITPKSVGTFDVVLCAGVLPVVRDIYTSIENLVSVSDSMVVIKTAVTNQSTSQPGMELWQDNSDRTWLPNEMCLEEILKDCGCSSAYTTRLKNTKSDDRIPDTYTAFTKELTKVSKTPDNKEIKFEIPPESQVEVIYEKNNALRIDYRSDLSQPNIQGWINPSSVQTFESNLSAKLKKARSLLRKEGVMSLTNASLKEFGIIKNHRATTIAIGEL
jgi:tRNA (mo5U34)-methyltransferase